MIRHRLDRIAALVAPACLAAQESSAAASTGRPAPQPVRPAKLLGRPAATDAAPLPAGDPSARRP